MPSPLMQCLDTPQQTPLADCLRSALLALPPGTLPLDPACTQGGLADDSDLSISVLESHRDADGLRARVGVFFTERVGGCSCHDDPVEAVAHAVIEVRLTAATGLASYRYAGDG